MVSPIPLGTFFLSDNRPWPLISDAVRPMCSTCAKSHTFAQNMGRILIDPLSECTYDETRETTYFELPAVASDAKIHRLETRLGTFDLPFLHRLPTYTLHLKDELETLLKEKSRASRVEAFPQPSLSAPMNYMVVIPKLSRLSEVTQISSLNLQQDQLLATRVQQNDFSTSLAYGKSTEAVAYEDVQFQDGRFQPSVDTDGGTIQAQFFHSTDTPEATFSSFANTLSASNPAATAGSWSWPLRLPPPDIMQKLVHTFFSCIPIATRIFHRPSFLSSLMQNPSSPQFPSLAVLHAICAAASVYSSMVLQPPAEYWTLADVFYDGARRKSERGESFGEAHTRYAKEEADELEGNGERLFECLQSPYLTHTIGYQP
jgi:hypothetical protein